MDHNEEKLKYLHRQLDELQAQLQRSMGMNLATQELLRAAVSNYDYLQRSVTCIQNQFTTLQQESTPTADQEVMSTSVHSRAGTVALTQPIPTTGVTAPSPDGNKPRRGRPPAKRLKTKTRAGAKAANGKGKSVLPSSSDVGTKDPRMNLELSDMKLPEIPSKRSMAMRRSWQKRRAK